MPRRVFHAPTGMPNDFLTLEAVILEYHSTPLDLAAGRDRRKVKAQMNVRSATAEGRGKGNEI